MFSLPPFFWPQSSFPEEILNLSPHAHFLRGCQMTKAWPIRAFHLQGQCLVQEWACDPGQANQRHLWNCARNISPTPTPTPSITVKEKNPGATWACCLRMGPIQKQSESKRASSEFPVQTLLTPDPQASEFYMLITYLFILFLKLDLGFT